MAQKKTTDRPGAPKRTQRMLTVNETRYAAFESIAAARRKKTGALVRWQDIANEAIDKYLP